jgi:putative transposase
MKDSLWSVDLIRCKSIALRTYWVLVVMDQFTRRIIGFGIQAGVVDGMALCRMFKQAIRGAGLPKYVSSDHGPLYRFHQWHSNLRTVINTDGLNVPLATPTGSVQRRKKAQSCRNFGCGHPH